MVKCAASVTASPRGATTELSREHTKPHPNRVPQSAYPLKFLLAPVRFLMVLFDGPESVRWTPRNLILLPPEPLMTPPSLPSLPPTDLLEDVPAEKPELDHERRMVALQKALEAFEVAARVVSYESGPLVTMYELELSPGTRVAPIIGLAPDLAISLAVPTIRVVYPLPGKATIGIEVPNPRSMPVRMRPLITSTEDSWRKMQLPLFLGQGATGRPILLDLQDLSHLLVAGTTGSGKSVCLTTLIMSMLLRRTPDELKLIFVDAKQMELSAFEDVPHLMAPLVADAKRAPAVLAWLIRLMEERHRMFEAVGVRTIEQFNALGKKKTPGEPTVQGRKAPDVPTHLPHIVVVVDELADLMFVSATQMEDAIVRLAKRSGAVGIHLVLATQRPSVDVLTGLIKSHMPNRISFKVSAMVDSRTILEQPGAEKLLGKGDMLLMTRKSMQLERGQCTWVTQDEYRRVVAWFLEKGGAATFEAELAQLARSAGGEGVSCDDPLFERAAEIVIRARRGSASLLQRKLMIGIGRTIKLMDALEKAGIVGPGGVPAFKEGVEPSPERNLTADPLLEAAIAVVVAHGAASAPLLQRVLRVGDKRALLLMRQMEGAGILGAPSAHGLRKVLLRFGDLRKRVRRA